MITGKSSKRYAEIIIMTLAVTIAIATAGFANDEAYHPFDQIFERLNDTFQKLPDATKNRVLLGGNEIVIIPDYKRNPKLPEVMIYKVIDATAQEVAAVLTDYNRHKDYFENGKLIQSEITKRISPTNCEVSYRLKILGKFITERYIIDYHLSQYDNGTSFRVDRKLVKGNRVKEVEAVGRIEPYGNKAMVQYFGYVDPGISLTPDEAIDKIAFVVRALEQQVMAEKNAAIHDRNTLLNTQVDKLLETLGATQHQ